MKTMTSILLAVAMMVACDNTISYDKYAFDYEDITTQGGSDVSGGEDSGDVEGGGSQTGVLAQPANRFLESIGMNSSLDARGESKEKTAEVMNYLGARWLRCGYGADTEPVFQYLIDNVPNIKFSMSVGTGGTFASEADFDRILNVAKYLKGKNALVALEGANEPNNWNIWYKGTSGGGHAQDSWMPIARLHADFYTAVKNDPVLRDTDVWTITCAGAQVDNVGLQFLTIPSGAGCLMPAGTQFADVVNVHNYFSHPNFPAPQDNQTWVASDPSSNCKVDGLYGNNGKTWMNKFNGYTEEECMNVRKVTTETGITIGGAVTEKMQGLMYITCYLAQFARDWEYTSMYILRDRSDEAGNQTFGFYTRDYQPRLAAVYMHNLTTILADNSSISNPGRVDYTIRNKTQMVHDLLLQKNDGTFALVVWGEYYASGGKADVVVDLGAEYTDVKVYNPIQGLEPVQSHETVTEVSLSVTNEPYIILFK